MEAIRKLIDSPLAMANTRLKNRLILAPMAGASVLSFRKLCHAYGCAATITELVSAKGILYDAELKRNARYLSIEAGLHAQAIQLFGAEPDLVAKASERLFLHPLYGQMDYLDLNMGCPVDKVVKTGAGSALMDDPPRAFAMIRAVSERAAYFGKAVTVKCRLGFREEHTVLDFAKGCEAAGAAAICIHGRTRPAYYSGKASWEEIAKVKAALSIPVIGNGDLIDLPSIKRMWEQTCVDAFMVGRAAMGNPFIFRSLLSGETPTVEEWRSAVHSHLEGLCSELGEDKGVLEFRGPLSHYIKGMHEAAKKRSLLFQKKEKKEVLALIDAWAEGLSL